jgi:hypothetical protein
MDQEVETTADWLQSKNGVQTSCSIHLSNVFVILDIFEYSSPKLKNSTSFASLFLVQRCYKDTKDDVKTLKMLYRQKNSRILSFLQHSFQLI